MGKSEVFAIQAMGQEKRLGEMPFKELSIFGYPGGTVVGAAAQAEFGLVGRTDEGGRSDVGCVPAVIGRAGIDVEYDGPPEVSVCLSEPSDFYPQGVFLKSKCGDLGVCVGKTSWVKKVLLERGHGGGWLFRIS